MTDTTHLPEPAPSLWATSASTPKRTTSETSSGRSASSMMLELDRTQAVKARDMHMWSSGILRMLRKPSTSLMAFRWTAELSALTKQLSTIPMAETVAEVATTQTTAWSAAIIRTAGLKPTDTLNSLKSTMRTATWTTESNNVVQEEVSVTGTHQLVGGRETTIIDDHFQAN